MIFGNVTALTIPEGNVKKITAADGAVLWTARINNLADPTSEDWKNGYRISSGGVTAYAGSTTSNYVAVEPDDVIRIYGVTFLEGNSGSRCGAKITTAAGVTADINAYVPEDVISGGITVISYEGCIDGVYAFKVHGDYEAAGGQIHAARFCFPTPDDAAGVIITINEAIPT